jgi:hypothetical protein
MSQLWPSSPTFSKAHSYKTRQAEEAKRAEAARKKAEREAQLAAEEATARAVPKGAKAKSAPKRSKGTLDLSHLDEPSSATTTAKGVPALNASGIENALDALALTTAGAETTKVDRHPERRYKAAYAAFEARRLPEIEQENPGLRRQQRIELCRKEFEKSEDNPFNKLNVAFDASREEIMRSKEEERAKIEGRLAAK